MRVHSGILDEVTAPARKALSAMAFLPDRPTSVAEVGQEAPGNYYQPAAPKATKPVDPTVLPLTIYLGSDGHLEDSAELTTLLLQDGATPRCPQSQESDGTTSSVDHRDWTARDLGWAWLAKQAGAPAPQLPPDRLFDQAWKTLTALPVETQRQRITAMRAHAAQCTGDLYADLTKERA
jgi:hypothetical protein